MSSEKASHINEAERLLKIISEGQIEKKEDYLFVQSMKARVKANGFVSEKQIYWLRDIKDRQLESEE